MQRIRQAAPEAEITVACGKTVYWNSERIAQSEKLHQQFDGLFFALIHFPYKIHDHGCRKHSQYQQYP